MSEIRFYHLTKQTLEQALPLILEKIMETGKRAVVRLGNEKEVTHINEILWTYRADSFLPHGHTNSSYPEHQPIWLTSGIDNPNAADTLIITAGCDDYDYENYDLCCHIFTDNDKASIEEARSRWKKYKDRGLNMTYWLQDTSGRWAKRS